MDLRDLIIGLTWKIREREINKIEIPEGECLAIILRKICDRNWRSFGGKYDEMSGNQFYLVSRNGGITN